MAKRKKQPGKRIDWKFYAGIGIALVTLLAMIYMYLYPTAPSKTPQLNIFFDPEKNTSYYGIYNGGDAPLKNVKTSYQIECQNIKYPNTYIRKEIPSLPPVDNPNSEYLHYFDNRTQNILQFSLENKELCKNGSMTEAGLNLSSWFFNENNGSFDMVFCDQCELKMNVTSEFQNKTENYAFIDPVRAKLNLKSELFPPVNCSGHWPCVRFNISWGIQDWWNTEPTSVDLATRIDNDTAPTKLFFSFGKSS